MIDIFDSRILDILPQSLSSKPEVQAISYAINMAMRRVLQYREGIKIFSDIEEATNQVLDMLGIELNPLYYDSQSSLEEKRDIISKALSWYEKAGTSSAVRELIESVYGFGEIQEWFKYDGEPFHFKVIVSSQGELVNIATLRKMIERVKKASSYLDTIEVIKPARTSINTGVFARSWAKSVIKEG